MFAYPLFLRSAIEKCSSWHRVGIVTLAIANAASGFGLSDISPTFGTLGEVMSVRNLAIVGALIAAFLMSRRPVAPVDAWSAMMALAVAMFAAYGVGLSGVIPGGQVPWLAVEPVVTLAVDVLLIVWFVRTRRDAMLFLGTLGALIGLAGFSIGLIEHADGSPLPLVPFYSSRMLIVGAMILLFFACAATRAGPAVALAAAAALLIFIGLTSNMRVAAVFYGVAWLVACLLLTAQRNYRAVLLGLFILAAAYLAHGTINGRSAVDKWNAYSPTIVREDAPAAAPVDVSACLGKSADLLDGRTPAPPELRYMCNRFFSIDDQDARIRLILHAIMSNPSPVFGAGFGRYTFIDAARPRSPADRYTYPHNIVAESYHAAGLIGLGLLGLSIAVAIVTALRASIATGLPIAVLMAIPAFTGMAALTGGNLYDARLLWLLPAIMAALASQPSISEGGP